MRIFYEVPRLDMLLGIHASGRNQKHPQGYKIIYDWFSKIQE